MGSNPIPSAKESELSESFLARAFWRGDFTEADDLASLHENVRDAVRSHFGEVSRRSVYGFVRARCGSSEIPATSGEFMCSDFSASSVARHETPSCSGHLFEDVGGFRSPDERLGML